MEKVKVVKNGVYRDGGTTEYRDIHNRAYIVPAPIYKEKRIYREVPERYFRHEGRMIARSEEYLKDLIIHDIELEIVDKL